MSFLIISQKWGTIPAIRTKTNTKIEMKKFFGFFSRMFGSNPRRRGRTVTFAALLAFNAPQDGPKFEEIRSQLKDFLRAGVSLNRFMIHKFSEQAAVKLEVNPLAFRILVGSLVDQLEHENGDENARLFIEGVVDALDMLSI